MSKTKVPSAAGNGPQGLIQELHRRKRSDADAYRRLVLDAADGRDISPEEAESVIEAAGETVEGFSKLVGRIVKRRKDDEFRTTIPPLQAAVDQANAAAEAKREEIRLMNEAANVELQKLLNAVRRAEVPLRQALDQETRILNWRLLDRKHGRDIEVQIERDEEEEVDA